MSGRRLHRCGDLRRHVVLVVLGQHFAGDEHSALGELAVLVPAPRTASVTALEPTLVLRVDQPVLDDLLADWPELTHGVIAELVARLRAAAEYAGDEQ